MTIEPERTLSSRLLDLGLQTTVPLLTTPTARCTSLRPRAEKDEVSCEESDGTISFHKDKKDCAMYYMCEGKRRHHMSCPQNLVFNINENVCDWPEKVEDCASFVPK